MTHAGGKVKLGNPHLDQLSSDVLYHLGLSTDRNNVRVFSNVKFVCMGGTPHRMRDFAEYIKRQLGLNDNLDDLASQGHRYAMYKVGPVLSISHGMGAPSFSILLHEILKLLKYAGCEDVTMIRLGTSGGIGIPAGSVVVSTGALNDLLEESHDFRVLGKAVNHPCILDRQLALEISSVAGRSFPEINLVNGKTMCASDFYEAQARLDGAFCDYTAADKFEFLAKLKSLNVVNIEMEASLFSAMCARAGVQAAIVCVTLVNRLDGDQVNTPKETLLEWQDRPQKVVAAFIKKRLGM